MEWLSGKTVEIISMLLGALIWAVGSMLLVDYTFLPAIPGIREAFVALSALAGAVPGMIWYKISYLGKARCIIIGVAIGVIAILNSQGVRIYFICGIFIIEMMSVLFRLLYYRQAEKNGKQNFKVPLMCRIQTKRISVMIFPPAYKIHDAKQVIRLWLIQFILATAVLTLIATI